MSNLGMSILYQTMNSLPFVWCERVFAPWGDMYAEMKQAGIPLYALESGDPLSAFDSIAFSIGYEMAYTTVLDMLDMAGLPLRSAERPSLLPLVWAGGTAAVNAEPMAPFIDLFVIGEGEEVNNEVLTLLRQAKKESWSKQDFLRRAAQIGGVYVPSLYEVSYRGDGEVAAVTPKDGAPAKVLKRIVEDLDASPFPTRPVVPSTEVVHDRVCLELFRGCVRGCRFCQAGHVYRPIRILRRAQHRPVPALIAGGQFLDGADAEAAEGAQKRPDLRRRGRQPAPAGCHQQERDGRGPAEHLRHRLFGRLEQCQAPLHAGPAD